MRISASPRPRVTSRTQQWWRKRSAWRAKHAGKIEIVRSAEEAVAGAQAVYTDVWASMGQEEESAAREIAFAGYQVNDALFSQAAPMRCFSIACRRIAARK